jgi:hypothetical protein
MRVLTCFVNEDRKVLVCLGGNKHGWETGTQRGLVREICSRGRFDH